jgi:hypothetical protein
MSEVKITEIKLHPEQEIEILIEEYLEKNGLDELFNYSFYLEPICEPLNIARLNQPRSACTAGQIQV